MVVVWRGPLACDPAKRHVAAYVSSDLVHWAYKGQALTLHNPENIGPDVIVERPRCSTIARQANT
jgi:hypothetical protein